MHTPEGQARQKKQEHRVARALDNAGIEYKREHHIDFRCIGDIDGAFARVDFLIIAHGKIVFLEVDETQHKFGYGNVSCDMKRMSKITESLALEGNTMPIVMLRYNPDGFSVDGKAVKKLKKVREAELVSLLKDPTADVFSCDQPLVIQYLYYDMSGEVPTITLDPDYNENIAMCEVSRMMLNRCL